MGFSVNPVDVTCDSCGLESEPVDLSQTWGGFTLDPARSELRKDGWIVDDGDVITCPECASDKEGGE